MFNSTSDEVLARCIHLGPEADKCADLLKSQFNFDPATKLPFELEKEVEVCMENPEKTNFDKANLLRHYNFALKAAIKAASL